MLTYANSNSCPFFSAQKLKIGTNVLIMIHVVSEFKCFVITECKISTNYRKINEHCFISISCSGTEGPRHLKILQLNKFSFRLHLIHQTSAHYDGFINGALASPLFNFDVEMHILAMNTRKYTDENNRWIS